MEAGGSGRLAPRPMKSSSLVERIMLPWLLPRLLQAAAPSAAEELSWRERALVRPDEVCDSMRSMPTGPEMGMVSKTLLLWRLRVSSVAVSEREPHEDGMLPMGEK